LSANEELARNIIEVIPPLMNLLRTEVRACAKPSLTVPQFRVLANVNRGLNHVADIASHHGVSQPSMTKLINNLVEKGLLRRENDLGDRRLINLYMTNDGAKLFNQIKRRSVKNLSKKMNVLNSGEIKNLNNLLKSFQNIIDKLAGDSI
jgi:MarR family transcriptional regulator for hemolysin